MSKHTSHSDNAGERPTETPPRRRRSSHTRVDVAASAAPRDPERRRRAGGRLAGGGQDLAQGTSVAANMDRREGHVEPAWEDIARRAYFRFIERGGGPGHDQDDWLEAESDLRNGR